MQELLEKRAKNREKQRVWREKNLERSKEIKNKSNWKARGIPQPRLSQEKRIYKSPSIEHMGIRIDDTTPIDVSLCMNCYRKYLTKLYCLWCNDKNYGRTPERTGTNQG